MTEAKQRQDDINTIGLILEWRPLCIVPQSEKNALASHLKDAGWDLGRIAAAVKSYHLATIPGLIMLGVAE